MGTLPRVSRPGERRAALTIPASLSIINDVFRDPAERARAIGAWAVTIGLGIAIGPIAGGLLLARFWWRSVFLVNVPIAVAGFAGALILVPDSKNPAADRPDPQGAVLSMPALACCYGQSSKPRPGAGPHLKCSEPGWPALWSWVPSSPGRHAAATRC